MSDTVIGDGLLADALALRPPPMLVVARDGWDTGGWAAAHDRGGPWLPVWTELDRVVVGPVVRPGEPGCVWCVQTWRSSAPQRDVHEAELSKADRIASRPSSWLTGFAADTVRELAHAGAAGDCCWYLGLRDLSLTRHAFLPDPLCRVCGALPDDTAVRAAITPRSRPKPRADATRVGELSESRLTGLYVDAETGVVAPPSGLRDALFPLAEAVLTEYGYRGEAGFGRARDFASCRTTAVAEALERLGGQWPWGKRTTVRGSYAELAEEALDPRSLGLFPPDRYLEPDCPYQPFTEDAVVSWVWGYSFREARPVLVPESHAYYRTALRPGADRPDKPFTFEISNGCALGGCLEEAILHGILEVVERDAFLMTWYARLPVPEVDLARAPDPRVKLVVERLERTGYRVRVFDMTLAEGIPAFWVLAEDTTGDGTRPKVVCTSGSALDPAAAVLTALGELAPIVEQELVRYRAEADRARRMAADPDLVRVMPDHALCAATPEAYERFSFLLDGDRVTGWDRLGRGGWDRVGREGEDRDRVGREDRDRVGRGGGDRLGRGGWDRAGREGEDRDRAGREGEDRDRAGREGEDRDRVGREGEDRDRVGREDRGGRGGEDRLGRGGWDRAGREGWDRAGRGGWDRAGREGQGGGGSEPQGGGPGPDRLDSGSGSKPPANGPDRTGRAPGSDPQANGPRPDRHGHGPWPLHTDLRDDLAEATRRMLAGGMDVVVVDQTSPLHEAAGLTCVKVIAPGALPMAFGHRNRRTTGLPRLREVPHRLGYAPRPLADADLNPYPHPFP
ncbi:TOMM precursor leader peptide-binding protein [Streptomyces sp. NPDC050610]|uniref:TOMM precursor leader peptide-binding protein n=1 Tax=Streptomyces sp. NPDC050610 TaxID=3157097 RepID=UPI00343425AB